MAARVTTRVMIPCFLYADFRADTDEEVRRAVRGFIDSTGLEDGTEHMPDGTVLYTEIGWPTPENRIDIANRTVEEEPELRKYRVGIYLQGAHTGDPDEIGTVEVMATSRDGAVVRAEVIAERDYHFGYEVEEVDDDEESGDDDGDACAGCGRGEGFHDYDCPFLEEV